MAMQKRNNAAVYSLICSLLYSVSAYFSCLFDLELSQLAYATYISLYSCVLRRRPIVLIMGHICPISERDNVVICTSQHLLIN
jgi:hypothetical protein